MDEQEQDSLPGNNIRTEFLNQLLKPDYSHLPPYIRNQLETAVIYTDFVLNFLMRKRNGIGKIDELVLKKNSINHSVKYFFEKENSVKFEYVKVLKKTDNYWLLKITDDGIRIYQTENCVKYKIYVPSFFTRFNLKSVKVIKEVGYWLFVLVPKNLKIIMDSGLIKFILFSITVVTFILKWKEIKQFIDMIIKK